MSRQSMDPSGNRRANNQTIGRLTNRAGGDLTASGTDLPYYNDFLSRDVAEVPPELANNYRAYREKKNTEITEQERLALVNQRNQPVTPSFSRGGKPSLPDRQQRYSNRVQQLDRSQSQPGPSSSSASSSRTFERKRKIYVDSKHRDTALYPDASDFVISWGRTFQNVKSMKLVSLEFPNVVQAIGPHNNTIQWINYEDNDLPEPFPVYSVSVRPGSYSLDQLGIELTALLKTVKRRGGMDGAPYHSFIVETDVDTDFVSFTSIIAKPVEKQPITTVSGSSRITFTQLNHGYLDNERIHIIGVQGYVGGIAAPDINGAYNINLIDDHTFSFQTQAVAVSTTKGGGTLISTGREAPFQFVFGESATTVAGLIGFPVENSATTLTWDGTSVIQDPMTTVIRPITDVISGSPFTQIVSPGHGLIPGDRVYLSNTFVTPSFYEDHRFMGVFEIFAVPSPDMFLIKYATERVSDITNAFIGTQIIQMYLPNHGFNRIASIEQHGDNVVLITTLFDHGFTATSSVRLKDTNCDPPIDGYYPVTPVDSDSFTISNPDPAVPLTLTSPGFKGILAADYNFRLYNVKAFGGFTVTDLNNTQFTVRDILDDNNFTFNSIYGYSEVWEHGGGAGVRINSKKHGWLGTQSNFLDGVLFRPVHLDGDNYAFMCIPGLNSDSITSTGPVKDIFAKIFITLVPGLVIFDAFDSSPIDFFTPVTKLDELRFTIRSPDDEIITFNGLDYSFGLELVEIVTTDSASDQTSKRLAPPPTELR